jgi:hypothetical protein
VLDGDFELTQASFEAWQAANADFTEEQTMTFQTGGQCRSGLNCVDAPVGTYLYGGWVVIRPGSAGTITFAAKPASGACGDVHGEVDLYVDFISFEIDAFVAQPDSASPGSDGWCTYTGHYTAEHPSYQTVEFILSSASETVFDDVVVVEDLKMRQAAQGERRTGDPETGRKRAAGRAKWKARQRAVPDALKARHGLAGCAGRTAAR